MSNVNIQNYAVVENGVVINVVRWDGESAWTPPTGATAVIVPDGVVTGIGALYSNGTFGALPPMGDE